MFSVNNSKYHIGVNGVSDACNKQVSVTYNSEYFVTIYQVKVIRGHDGKKIKVLNFGVNL